MNRPTFAQARNIVLLALYERLHDEDVQHYFDARELKEYAGGLSGAMLTRAARSLVDDSLVERRWDEHDDDRETFGLTDFGILAAESLSAGFDEADQEIARIPQSSILLQISNDTDLEPAEQAVDQAVEAIRGSNTVEETKRKWIREHLLGGKMLLQTRVITQSALKALLLEPLQAAWKTIGEEKGKLIMLAAIKAIKALFGWA